MSFLRMLIFLCQWKRLVQRVETLSEQLNKPDLWEDPVHAGKISREHGSLIGKLKEVNSFEQELFEYIDMIKLAREDNDSELESVGPQFLPSEAHILFLSALHHFYFQ